MFILNMRSAIPRSHRGYSTKKHAAPLLEAGIAQILHTKKEIPDHLSPTPSHLLNLLFSDILSPPTSETSSIRYPPPSESASSLPQGHHLAYFPLQSPPSGLMPDGTDPDHCPGKPFTRRLWAGGEVRFRDGWEDEFRLDGRRVGCVESVEDVRPETGRVWVELWRRYGAATAGKTGDPAIEERRTLAFLPEIEASAPVPTRRSLKPPYKPTLALALTPMQNLLTNFSALTYNAHAIHLDPAWAAREGHPTTLVHGPLCLALVLAFLGQRAGQRVRWLGYRNLAPLYCGREMTVCARERGGGGEDGLRKWDVWIEDSEGGMAVKGAATTADA